MLYNFVLAVFPKRNFLQAKYDFKPKTAVLRFWAPFRGSVQWLF